MLLFFPSEFNIGARDSSKSPLWIRELVIRALLNWTLTSSMVPVVIDRDVRVSEGCIYIPQLFFTLFCLLSQTNRNIFNDLSIDLFLHLFQNLASYCVVQFVPAIPWHRMVVPLTTECIPYLCLNLFLNLVSDT